MMVEMLGRREVLAAASLTALTGLLRSACAVASPAPRSLFAGSVLASNPLAAKFEALSTQVHVPATLLQTSDGNRRLADLHSPATLVTLWAEFCAPCLMEMPDLAHLGDRYRAAGFNVISLHVGGSLQSAQSKLESIKASTIPAWNDPQAKTVTALATPSGTSGFTLPCNVLVDRAGRVRGRAFGAQPVTPMGERGHSFTPQEKEGIAHAKSAWSLPAADQFAQVLAGGLLGRI
jgi:thiol-disulfide isomerase/thioredoxin